MKQVNWISEEQALSRLGYSDRKYFRRLVRGGTLPISYRCTPTKRNYQYDEKAIERILNEQAIIIQ